MPSRVWSHLCDYGAVDAVGKAMMIGEFDHLFTQGMPSKYPLCFVITKWLGSEGETFTHSVRIVSPSKNQVALSQTANVRINRGPDGSGMGTHIQVDGFMMLDLPEFGEYAVEILLNGEPIHILPFTVRQVVHNPLPPMS